MDGFGSGPERPQDQDEACKEDCVKARVMGEVYELPSSAQIAKIATDKEKEEVEEREKNLRAHFGALLQVENVSFLLGAGASKEAGGPMISTIPEDLIAKIKASKPKLPPLFFGVADRLRIEKIDGEKTGEEFHTTASADGREKNGDIAVNLEAFLSRLEQLRAAMGRSASSLTLPASPDGRIQDLPIERGAVLDLRKAIVDWLVERLRLPTDEAKKESGKGTPHKGLVRKILTRPTSLRRANIFTLNYDTLVEQACDGEGIVVVDGFVGTMERVFRPESYDVDFYFPGQTTEGNVHRYDRTLHLCKLHGSINWRSCKPKSENPHGLHALLADMQDGRPQEGGRQKDDRVMIYPTPLKEGEALGMPYSEMFRRFGNAISQPQSVLFVVGYGFGDPHVDSIILQALAAPSMTLVIVDPCVPIPRANTKESDSEPRKSERLASFLFHTKGLGTGRIWLVRCGFGTFVERVLPDLKDDDLRRLVVAARNKLFLHDRHHSPNPGENNHEQDEGQ